MVRERDWYKTYSGGWQNEIVSEAFSHPAKFARGLIRRIYEYALEQGYLREGDTVLDPFGGIALGAADTLANGLNFVGVELEQNFVDMGAGCDCTSISKDDWIACFGRWKRFAYKDGRHWCPRCLTEAEQIIDERKVPKLTQIQAKRWAKMRELIARTGRKVDFNLYAPMPFPESHRRQATKAARLFGAEVLIASYKRSGGKIPHTVPHYYAGNLDLFARHARGGATAVLVQGDSRRLVEVLGGARAEGIIASPPYATQTVHNRCDIDPDKLTGNPPGPHSQVFTMADYGDSDGQLGNMPTGEPPQVGGIIASPPFSQSQQVDNRKKMPSAISNTWRKRFGQITDGTDSANLGNMPTGEPPQAIDMRCPYCFSPLDDDDARGESLFCADCGEVVEYVDAWECAEESLAAIISSPPFVNSQQSRDAGFELESTEVNPTPRKLADRSYFPAEMESDGQPAQMKEGEPPAAIVSSPPFSDRGNQPCIGQGVRKDIEAQGRTPEIIWDTPNNLGNTTGDTFWSAAHQIISQCYQVLAPGGYAIWVLKDFIRNKRRVDFTGQWRSLCESCGFETVEVIRAWLTEDRGAQFALNGDLVERKVAHKSFFRRLHERKYPHLAIDYEIVLITRKGDKRCTNHTIGP